MASTQPVVKFTYEDYLTTPADKRYELLDGELIMVPAPNLERQKVQRRLGQRLSQFIEEQDLGVCAVGRFSARSATTCSGYERPCPLHIGAYFFCGADS